MSHELFHVTGFHATIKARSVPTIQCESVPESDAPSSFLFDCCHEGADGTKLAHGFNTTTCTESRGIDHIWSEQEKIEVENMKQKVYGIILKHSSKIDPRETKRGISFSNVITQAEMDEIVCEFEQDLEKFIAQSNVRTHGSIQLELQGSKCLSGTTMTVVDRSKMITWRTIPPTSKRASRSARSGR